MFSDCLLGKALAPNCLSCEWHHERHVWRCASPTELGAELSSHSCSCGGVLRCLRPLDMAAPYGLVIGWCAGLDNRCLKCPIKSMFINNTMVPKEFMFLNHQMRPVQCWEKRGRDFWRGEATHWGNWGDFFNNKQRISNFVVDQYSLFLLPGNLFDRNRQVPAAPGGVHRPAAPNPLPGDYW